MNYRVIIILSYFFILTSVPSYSQSIIFLHHSTGGNVYEEGKVPGWITDYNSQYGTSYKMTEKAFPTTPYPWENYPYDYWNLWLNNACNNSDPDIWCLDKLCADYDVIIFKHCFPGSGILADDPVPSVSSSKKTLANYKLQYRALRALLDSYPDNKFIIWTLAPLHRLATTTEEAGRARQFVDWVKNEWLHEDGKEHPNIYIFDFFNLVAESNPTPLNGKLNCLKYDYERSHTDNDSHPNSLANVTVGPIFAQFIINSIEGSEEIKVTNITVSGYGGSTAIATDGGTLQLTASISPANATNKTVTWSIQNGTGQAAISTSGLVTAIADGTVTAKATATDGSGVSGSLVISISNQNVMVTGINISGLDGANTIATTGGTLQLTAIVTPSNATNKTVTWSIQNGTGQAAISTTGLVTAIADGTVNAKATANDGSGVTGNFLISITGQTITVTMITVTSISGATSITTDNGTLQLIATVLPANATNKEVEWSVINITGKATISPTGLLTAVSNGNVTANAVAKDGSNANGQLIISISNQTLHTSLDENVRESVKLTVQGNILYIKDSNMERNAGIKIFDLQGRLLFNRYFISENMSFDLSSFPSGLYLISIVNQFGEYQVIKIIKP